MKWQKPELIVISTTKGKSDPVCFTGSGANVNCNTGTLADNNCIGGISPSHQCINGSVN